MEVDEEEEESEGDDVKAEDDIEEEEFDDDLNDVDYKEDEEDPEFTEMEAGEYLDEDEGDYGESSEVVTEVHVKSEIKDPLTDDNGNTMAQRTRRSKSVARLEEEPPAKVARTAKTKTPAKPKAKR